MGVIASIACGAVFAIAGAPCLIEEQHSCGHYYANLGRVCTSPDPDNPSLMTPCPDIIVSNGNYTTVRQIEKGETGQQEKDHEGDWTVVKIWEKRCDGLNCDSSGIHQRACRNITAHGPSCP